MTARNYLDVYPYEKWVTKEIPVFHEGATFMPTNLLMHQGSTTAPELLKESDLIAMMDKHGIGTDATIAQHIQTVQDRNYAEMHNRSVAFESARCFYSFFCSRLTSR